MPSPCERISKRRAVLQRLRTALAGARDYRHAARQHGGGLEDAGQPSGVDVSEKLAGIASAAQAGHPGLWLAKRRIMTSWASTMVSVVELHQQSEI